MSNIVQESATVGAEAPVSSVAADAAIADKLIGAIRVVVVNNLIHEATDFSKVARRADDFDEQGWLKQDRYITGLALANIEHNIRNLAETPEIKVMHLSEVSRETIDAFDPDAVVLSGTLRDFDYYDDDMVAGFADWVRATDVPVLGICGGHQLVGLSFGAEIITIDRKVPSERRRNRLNEYQYRFVKIVKHDPIFDRIEDRDAARHGWHNNAGIMRVWQNHGLMVDRLPDGFDLLAAGYMCPIQMMVRRTHDQLIYTVQFHIEKSFEDWNRKKSFWDHHVESRDGRIIFENFLVEALKRRLRSGDELLCSQ